MFFLKARNTRRAKSTGPRLTSADILESRQLLSGTNQLHAALTGSAGASGAASYEAETEHGKTQQSFSVNVSSATPNTSYSVSVDGVSVGQIQTNVIGRGKLEFNSNPEGHGVAFPSNWAGLSTGSAVSVDGLVSGTLSNGNNNGGGSDGGSDTDHDGGNEGTEGNRENQGDENSSENSEAGLYAVLSGVGVEAGTAGFSTQNEHGQINREFELEARNLTPDASYPVTVDGVSVGTVTANSRGYGQLKLSDKPHGDAIAFPADFPAVSVNSTVQVGIVLDGTFSGNSGLSNIGNTDTSSDHQRTALTGTGSMSGVVDFEQKLAADGSLANSELQVDVWNGTPGTQSDVTVDGVVVGSITINARGYGQLRLKNEHGVSNFPADWPGIHAGSVAAVGSEVSGTFDSTSQLADPSQRELQDAYELDHRLQLHAEHDMYENWGGKGEKWLRGENNKWYFVTNDGSLYEWDGHSSASGKLVEQLDPAIYKDPAVLYNAVLVAAAAVNADAIRFSAAEADNHLELSKPGSGYQENWGHQGEKWITGKDGWYFITPAGELHKWDGSKEARGELVTVLDSSYHADPNRLTNAVSGLTVAEKALSADQGLKLESTGSDHLNWGGRHEKWVQGKDKWYFITEDGGLYEWNKSRKAEGTLVTQLSKSYYDDLTRLTSAASIGNESDEAILDKVFTDFSGVNQ